MDDYLRMIIKVEFNYRDDNNDDDVTMTSTT